MSFLDKAAVWKKNVCVQQDLCDLVCVLHRKCSNDDVMICANL
jgi:hypothetical protein